MFIMYRVLPYYQISTYRELRSLLTNFSLSWFLLQKAHSSLFIYLTDIIVLLIYVDDVLVVGHNTKFISSLLEQLNHEFSIKDLSP